MIYINDIPSFRDPEKAEVNFEHRIERIELIGRTVAQDFGHIPTGDRISLECVFTKENYTKLEKLWEESARVTYTDEAGVKWEDLKLVFYSRKYVDRFRNYISLTFELWRAPDLPTEDEGEDDTAEEEEY